MTSFEVRTYDLLTGAQHVLCEVENPHAVSWTSDGIQLAFQGDDSVVTRGKFWIWIVNRDGSGLHRISSGPHDQYPVWSHDGRSLAWSRGEQLWQGDRDARAGRFLTKAPEAYHFQRALCWLPDGRHLRYVLEAEFGAVSTVRVVGADSTDDSQDPWMTSSVVGGLVGASSDDGTFMYRGLGHMLEFYGDLRSGAPIRRCFVQDSVVVSHLALATDKSFAVFDDFEPESGPDKLWLVRWKQAKGH